MKTTTRRLYTLTIAFNTLVTLIPSVLMFFTIYLHGAWPDAVDAWHGEYVNPFFSQITNPWLDILPVGAGLLLAYVLCISLAFKTIHIPPRSVIFTYRRWFRLLFLLIASIIFFAASVLTLIAHTAFGDFKLDMGSFIPQWILVGIPLILLTVNQYLLHQLDYNWMLQSGRKIDIIERLRHKIRSDIAVARETDAAEADLLAISFQSTIHPSHTVWICSYHRRQIRIDLETRTSDGEWVKDDQSLTVKSIEECLAAVSHWLNGTA